MTNQPDYALPVGYRLPREGILVQVWFAGHDNRWAYARRRGDIWEVDSRELPDRIPVSDKLITHWCDAPPEPGEIDDSSMFDHAADVILDALPIKPRGIKGAGETVEVMAGVTAVSLLGQPAQA